MIGLSLPKHTSVWRAFILASAFLPLAQVAHAATDAIFQSNFESGLSGWSPTDRSLDNGNLSVTTAAGLALTAHGLSAVVNDTKTLYVQDNTPSREGQYRVRFYFSPHGFKTGSATARVRLLNAYDSSLDRSVVEVFLLQTATGAYSVGASYRLNDRSLLTTPLTPISNGPHYVEFNWKRSTTTTAKDGVFQLWVDNQPTASVATLTTGALGVDYARFGAVTGLNSLSQGTLLLDQFVSRRLSYIGPEAGGTPPSPAPSPTPSPSPTPRPSPTPTPRPSPTPTPVPSPTPIPIPSPTPTPTPTPSPVPTPPPSGGLPIGEWTDSPGACPSGTTVVTLNSVAGIASAARGEGTYASNPASTCYFIQNGTYHQSGSTMLMLIEKGGAAGAPRRFVGQSRDGVVLVGRANVDVGVQHVVIQNLTFSLTGYSQSGSFNTMDVSGGSGDVLVDHVTFTGDCNTGANGGHIETNGVDGLVVQNSLIEKFGRCGTSAGHQDHGIYLAGASNVTLFNNIIRGNSSRGIQMYTQGGQYGTLNNITVRQNRIYQNGHADYEDGMVINGSGSGTITNVSIDHNLIYRNYYSGIRFAGPATMSISVVDNTFEGNGAGSGSSARSEINIDDSGNGAHATMQGNIFSVGNTLINNCYNATSLGFGITDNVVFGRVPTGTAGNCVSQVVNENPLFVNSSAGDYHTTNPDVSQYGPY